MASSSVANNPGASASSEGLRDGAVARAKRRHGGWVTRTLTAGTSLTNSTTETALASGALAANTLTTNTLVRVVFANRCTNETGATTATTKLRLGTTASATAGTVLFTGAATDLASGAINTGEFFIGGRALPSGDVALSFFGSYAEWAASPALKGVCSPLAAGGGTVVPSNAELYVKLTCTLSAADANAVQNEGFAIYVVG